jgi:hypothetical protein
LLAYYRRWLDEHGKPVADAVVHPTGITTKEGKFGGTIRKADPLAVTDERGEFRIGLKVTAVALYATVEARLLAPRQTGPLPPGPKVNRVKLVAGATVCGKVVNNGKPLAGVQLCLRQNMFLDTEKARDRARSELTFSIATDEKGAFRFVNVPPDEDYVVIGIMESFRRYGALKARPVVVKGDRTTCDLGVQVTQPGFRLAGRIVLADGKAVPPGTLVCVERRDDGAYEAQIITAGADGRFAFSGVPDELCQLSTQVKGYRVSTENYSCDRYFGRGLWGKVNADIDDLRFLLEPGTFARPKFTSEEEDEIYRRQNRRMQGVPAPPLGSRSQYRASVTRSERCACANGASRFLLV